MTKEVVEVSEAPVVPQYNVHEAKTHLSRILERVAHGEEIVISRAGTPVARIVPIERPSRRASLGSLEGILVLDPDWDSRRTNEEIAGDFYA
ncbi:MAG: type II toxin-antitoxin system Phd/YefM family antitoxin [Kineosporiaceae bacterium]